MSYALQTLWHERSRYASGVFAVTFSAVLIALQCGLLLGLFKITSIPVDYASSDKATTIWVGSKDVQSVDLGRPIPTSYVTRVAGLPGVQNPELYIASFGNFQKPIGGTELCFLLGSSTDETSAAVNKLLTPEVREALTEPFTFVCDQSDLHRLGLDRGSDVKPKINNREVRLVGTVSGLKSLAAPWMFCSVHTARQLLGPLLPPDHITYLVARCDSPERARQAAAELQAAYPGEDQKPSMTVYVAEDFSLQSRSYWLFRTKAGVAIGYAALLGLLVGAVITYQTLYSATAASAKEFAILLALGIPRWRISLMVLAQSFWVGVIGIGLAYPACVGLQLLAAQFNTDVDLRAEVLAGTALVTVTMALLAGILALRSVRQIEPMTLLR